MFVGSRHSVKWSVCLMRCLLGGDAPAFALPSLLGYSVVIPTFTGRA